MSIFTEISAKRPPNNTFSLSHDRKQSMKMGELTPILAMEIVPGDKITINTSQMLRFAPLIAPVMHKITCYTHFYFVPNRLGWDNWEGFITGGEDGNNSDAHPYIIVNNTNSPIGSLADYMGIPQLSGAGTKANALPFSAYQRIYNEYYRDQNLITEVEDDLVNGNNTSTQVELTTMRTRAWQHDYFTSALPWTQKGVEATIPLGTSANLIYDGFASGAAGVFLTSGANAEDGSHLATDSSNFLELDQPVGATLPANIDVSGQHTVDLSTATAASINDLRQAFRLQEWLEKNARGGTRYIESIKSHFGVSSKDSRLQRPEYLGGGSTPVTISEVLQTSSNASEPTPQGNMAGHGISIGNTGNISYYAREHGYIIGIMSILPKTAYYQGVPKHFQKFDKFDYYWPSFAHLGEQPILNQELTLQYDEKDQQVFGYIPRYAEYKHHLSSVHGQFRTTLDFWHMARKFDNTPYLNEEFITSNPDTSIFAVETDEQIYAHIFHDIKANRLMPYFGTPTT